LTRTWEDPEAVLGIIDNIGVGNCDAAGIDDRDAIPPGTVAARFEVQNNRVLREIARRIADHDRVLRAGQSVDQASGDPHDILIGPAGDPEMRVEAAKAVDVLELVLLPVEAVDRRAGGLRLAAPEADAEISYPALRRIQVVRYRAERNDIDSRIVLDGNDGSSGTVAFERYPRSGPRQRLLVDPLRTGKRKRSGAEIYGRAAQRRGMADRRLNGRGVVAAAAIRVLGGAEVPDVDVRAGFLPRAEKARAVMESIGTVRSRRLGQYRRRE